MICEKIQDSSLKLLHRHLRRLSLPFSPQPATDSQVQELHRFRVPCSHLNLSEVEASALLSGFREIRRTGGAK